MSETDKDILKNLKDKGSSFELPVEDFVWDNIEKEIAPQETTKPIIWWKKRTFLLLLVLLLGAGVYALMNQKERLIQNKRASVNLLIAKTEVKLNTLDVKNRMLNYPSESKNKNQTNIFSLSQPALQLNKAVVKKELNNLLSLEGSINTALKVGEFKNNDVSQNIPSVGIDKSKNEEVDRDFGNVLALNNKDSENGGSLQNLNVAKFDAVDIQKEEDSMAVGPAPTPFTGTDSITSDFEANEVDTTTEDGDVTAETIEVEDYYRKKEKNFSLMMYGGLGQSFRTLKSEANNSLITHKNDHEAFGNAYDFGIAGEMGLFKRSFVRFGFGYKFYSDKYDFTHGTLVHQTKNDYQYFQLPVYYGYNMLQKKKTNVALLGGFKVNALFSAQSSWLDPEVFTPVAHNTLENETSPFRTFSTALTIGLDYNVSLAPQLKLHVISSADAFLNSVYKRAVDISQKPYSLNLNVGLSYSF